MQDPGTTWEGIVHSLEDAAGDTERRQGNVDIELTYGRRITDQRALSTHARACGRAFGTYVDQVTWPSTELFLHPKKRSAFINITLEDFPRITDRFETIYSIDGDPQAVPPPADKSLIGR